MRLGLVGGVLCTALWVAVPAMPARAAPADASTSPTDLEPTGAERNDAELTDAELTDAELIDAEPDSAPSLDDARLTVGREMHARGQQLFDDGEYRGAIEAWEQVLVVMPDKEAALRVNLAHAHRRVYDIDGDVQHLHTALGLFTDELAGSSAGGRVRQVLEAEIAEIEGLLAAIEQATAEARAEREEEQKKKQQLREQQLLAQADERLQRTIRRVYYGVGGSLVALGGGSLAVMGTFLANGSALDQDGWEIANMVDPPEGRYQELIAAGKAENRKALAAGLVGGALVASGASVLIVAVIRQRRGSAPPAETVAVTPTFGGVHLRF